MILNGYLQKLKCELFKSLFFYVLYSGPIIAVCSVFIFGLKEFLCTNNKMIRINYSHVVINFIIVTVIWFVFPKDNKLFVADLAQ